MSLLPMPTSNVSAQNTLPPTPPHRARATDDTVVTVQNTSADTATPCVRCRRMSCICSSHMSADIATPCARYRRHTVRAEQTNELYLLTMYGRRQCLTVQAVQTDEQSTESQHQFPLSPRSVTATVPARESLYNNRFRVDDAPARGGS